MKRVGITGGMGCGKSTVVAEFERMGVPCFVADKAGLECYTDAQLLLQVQSLLGNDVINLDGSANRQVIATKVFSDKSLLTALNALIHPRVMQQFDQFCLRHQDAEYVLFESAILYEEGLDRLMDRVVCVYLDLHERLQRLEQRDHTTPERLMQRIENQLPAEESMLMADYVVLNYEGNPRRRQVEYIDKQLRQ